MRFKLFVHDALLSENLEIFHIDPESEWEMAAQVEQIAKAVGVSDSCHKIYGNLGEHQELF